MRRAAVAGRKVQLHVIAADQTMGGDNEWAINYCQALRCSRRRLSGIGREHCKYNCTSKQQQECSRPESLALDTAFKCRAPKQLKLHPALCTSTCNRPAASPALIRARGLGSIPATAQPPHFNVGLRRAILQLMPFGA